MMLYTERWALSRKTHMLLFGAANRPIPLQLKLFLRARNSGRVDMPIHLLTLFEIVQARMDVLRSELMTRAWCRRFTEELMQMVWRPNGRMVEWAYYHD